MGWAGSPDEGKKICIGMWRESLGRWQMERERRGWDKKMYKINLRDPGLWRRAIDGSGSVSSDGFLSYCHSFFGSYVSDSIS
jgi:hypothetical protein